MTVQINGTTGVTTPQLILTNGTSTVTLLPPASGTQTGTPIFQSTAGALTLTNSTGGSLILQPAAGSTTAQTLAFPATAGSNGQVLTSDGSGGSTWVAAAGGLTIGTTAIGSGTTGSILINTSNVLQQLVMGAGVSGALAAATNSANGFPILGAGGVLQPAQGGTGVNSLGAGVGAALQNAAGGANGLATLDANGILPTSQGGTGTSSPAGTVAVGSATQTGTLTLYNSGAGANPLSIQSAVNTVPWTLTLPTNGGTNGQVLATNGSGTTSWITPAVVAGANTQVMYNSSGALAGAAGFTFDGVSSVTLGVGSTSNGKIVLNNSANTNTLTIQAGATAASQTFTLPTTTGTNGYLLSTNGTGVLSWSSPSTGEALNGNFDIGTPSSGGTPTTGTLNLFNSSSTDGVTISSGNNTSPWTLTLPTGPGVSGQLLQTDGSGVTSWISGDITIGTTAIALGATSLVLDGLTSVTVTQDPTSGLELATKQYVDAITSPIARTSPAKCATSADISLSGLQTIDGYTTVAGDRVLVKAQTASQDDGVYIAAAGPWSRAADANQPSELTACACFVLNGTLLANTSWIQTEPVTIVGTSTQSWAQQAGLNNYNAGLGINIAGGNLIENTGVVVLDTGTTGLSNTFTALTGTAQLGGTLAVTHGGTGAATASGALTALLPTQSGNPGKVLTTDGTVASWEAPTAASATGGTFSVGTGPGVTGTLSLYNAANANGVSIRSGVNSAAWTLTLPQNGGTNGQVLQTDGSGATTWTTLVNSGTAGQLAWYSATGTSVSGNANVTVSSGALTVGVTGTQAGSLVVSGGTTGAVTVQAANNAGTWSLTLPTTAGTVGQVLRTDGSGVTSWVSNDVGLTIGTTAIASGTTGSLLINTAGVLQEVVMGTGVAAALAVNAGDPNGLVVLDSSGNLPAATSGTFGTAGPAGTTGTIDLFNSTNANALTIQPGVTAAAWTLTLPTSAGSANQVLQTDGNGVTSWVTPSSGLTIGTTAISGGTSGRILYNNANKVEEKSVTGSGDVVLKSGPEITSLRETKTNGSISGGTLAIDCALGNVLAIPLNANITSVTFSNVPASGSAYSVILSFTADGTARTITWPAAVRWPNGTAPTMTSTNNKVDTIVLYTYDAGTNWFGFVSGQNA